MVGKTKQISKYEKTNKLVEIVKKCKIMQINDDAIINTILFETGREITKKQLGELVEIARREVREQQIEVDVHMEHMVKIGLYTDAMNQHEMLTVLERIIYSEILDEAVKGSSKNRNIMLAMSNTLVKVFSAKNETITNIAFLSKTRAIWEQKDNIEGGAAGVGGTAEPKAVIMVKNQKQNVEKLIDESIDKKELERNRVA